MIKTHSQTDQNSRADEYLIISHVKAGWSQIEAVFQFVFVFCFCFLQPASCEKKNNRILHKTHATSAGNAYLWKERFLSPQSTFVLQCVKCGLNAPTPVFYTELKHFPVSVGTLQWDRVRVEWVDLKFVFIIIIQNLPITVVKIVWYLKTKEHHTRQVLKYKHLHLRLNS